MSLRQDVRPRSEADRPDGHRADRWAGMAAAGLFAAAVVAGALLGLAGHPVHAPAAPLFAHPLPHVGPGTPIALALAALVLWRGPGLAARLAWRPLLALSYLASAGWIFALALVDGWQRGLAGRLATPPEYLSEVGGVIDVPAMLHGFAARIAVGPDAWTTHVSGHPPGALLVFVGLDRIGLGGGGWAAVVCVLVGAAAAVAVPVTVRVLGEEEAARAAVPFIVLLPGAVWIGASADGLFAGVAATGLALLAIGLRRSSWTAALAAGLLLASTLYLSYGLVLLGPLVLAIVLLARRVRPLLWTAAGGITVLAAFTAAGFNWLDGYHLVQVRYYQGLASRRPYAYWVWGDLAAFVACAGPVAAPILRRAVRFRLTPQMLLPLAAMAAVIFADLSGLSKAEVERIWLPFAVWLPAGAALLPAGGRRGWLAVQATVALLVNHLALTTW